MEPILTYIVKVNIALAVFYLLYMLLFSKDTFIRLRRYYFLSAIVFSLSYPLFTVSALGNLINAKQEVAATSVYIGDISMGEVVMEDIEEAATPIDWIAVANHVLLLGTIALALRLLFQLLSIIRIKSKSKKRTRFNYLFYHLKDEMTPFSFFKWIFIHADSHNENELKQILLHEHTHVCQWHSIDILLVELLRVAFWWNPVVWMIKRDVAINLEYLADEAVLQKGVETTEYQYHLLQLTNHETAVQIVNNFNVSQLKQRIIMMNKNKSPMRKMTKYLSVLPLALLLITANSVYAQQNEPQVKTTPPQEQEPVKKESKNNDVFVVVEKQPEFPGGAQKLMEWLGENIEYPKEAHEKRIEGRVIVNFVVEKDGTLSDINIVRGQDPLLDAEAIRAISTMPKWKPGMQRGEAVRVRYTLPIVFRIPQMDTKDKVAIGYKQPYKDGDNEVIVMKGSGSMKENVAKTLAEKFGDGQPLFVVDGVKMKKSFNTNDIDPKDIDNITVLKNESSVEQYGEEGKNGVIMITTKKSKYRSDAVDAAKQKLSTDKEDIFVVVEDQPEFPGGMSAMMEYLGENIKYPVEAQKNKIEGRVIVNFVVEKDGSLSNFKIVRGQDPLLDAEAIRVLSTMPKWKPGMQRGQTVKVRFTVPIVFRLRNDEKKENESTQKLKEDGPVSVVDMKTNDPEKAFYEFIGKTIRYPVIAQENGIMGLSKATYDVNAEGEVSNVKTTEGIDPSLDAELRRMIKLMPKDIALMKSGGKAASNVEISALFRLQNGESVPPPPEKSDVVVVGYGKPTE